MKNLIILLLCLNGLTAALLPSCRPREPRHDGEVSVLVFITGVLAGSPTFEMLASGALQFAEEHENVTVRIYEAGFNQALWEEQLLSMVAEGGYDLVLGSNPALPEIAASVGRNFPSQRFIIFDAQYSGNAQISTFLYNQYEQALFLGYLAGLLTTGDMPLANASKRIGFIAAQEFPILNRHMLAGFLDGARMADPDIELDFRVIGNWFDAAKAAELAASMLGAGVDVFTSVAGNAAQGMLRAIEGRAYALSFNINEYSRAPGVIIGCGSMEQKRLVRETLAAFLDGAVEFGGSGTVGVQDGYISFIFDDPGFRDHVPAGIQERFAAFMDDMRAGRMEYTVPPL